MDLRPPVDPGTRETCPRRKRTPGAAPQRPRSMLPTANWGSKTPTKHWDAEIALTFDYGSRAPTVCP